MKKIWILWWRYDDSSASQIVRAYEDEKRANEDFALVEEDTSRRWLLDEVPYICTATTYYDENVMRG